MRREQGDVARIRLGRQPFFLVSHPELVREVLVVQHRDYVGETVAWAGWTKPEVSLRPGLLRSRDPGRHLAGRRHLQAIFRERRLNAHETELATIATRASERWQPGQELDVVREMDSLALEMLGASVFGGSFAGSSRSMQSDLDRLLAVLSPVSSRLLEWGDRGRLLRAVRLYRAYQRLLKVVSGRLDASGEGDGADDLPALLRRVQDEVGLTSEDLAAEAFIVLFAGYETTATALAWCFALLASDPWVEERLLAELEAASDGAVGPFTTAVLHEVLRLYPPSWYVGRRALRAGRLESHEIAAGASVWVSPFVIHRDARWFEDPEAFRPERWLTPAKERPRLAFMPFGAGLHQCLGEPLARRELVAALRAILPRRRLRLAQGARLEPVAVSTLRPRRLLMTVVAR